MSVRFTQSCPTCGRRIQVRASLLGCTVACQHCNAEFVAQARSEAKPSIGPSSLEQVGTSDPLMQRVELALERAKQQPTVTS